MIDINAEFRKAMGVSTSNVVRETKTVLTLDMIRDAKKLLGDPPPHQQIKCGDLDEFAAAMLRKTGQTCPKMSKSYGVFAGIEVVCSPLVPIDRALVFENGEVKSIINLREGD